MNDETRVGSAVSVSDDRSRDKAILEVLSNDPTVGVWAVSRDMRVTYANTVSAGRVGLTPEQAVGRHLREILPEEVVEQKRAYAERVLRGERVSGRMVWRGQRLWSDHLSVENEHGVRDEMVVVTRVDRCVDELEGCREFEEADFVVLGELDVLTSREIEVLALLGKGMRTDDIAKHLTRSPKTIQRFQEGIRAKLGITDRCLLAQLARDRGLEQHHASLPRVEQAVA